MRHVSQKSLPSRAVIVLSDDHATVDLHDKSARDGRYALWGHLVDGEAANRAIRSLADFDTLHIRHYAHRAASVPWDRKTVAASPHGQ